MRPHPWFNLLMGILISLAALLPTVVSAQTPTRSPRVRVEGIVTALSTTQLTVDGQAMQLTTSTRIDRSRGNLEVGALVRVSAERTTAGQLVAIEVEVRRPAGSVAEPTQFRGTIRSLPASGTIGQWTVGDTTFQVTAETRIQGTPAVGAQAEVQAIRTSTGIVARQIEVHRPSTELREVEFNGTLSAFDATRWVVGSTTVLITTTTRIEGTPTVGAQVEVKGLRGSDGTITGVSLRVRTPQEREVEIRGVIQTMASGSWVVGGRTVLVDSSTVVDEREGSARVGAEARVDARQRSDGTLVARRIRILRAQVEEVELRGVIQTITPSFWIVQGITVTIAPTTVIRGVPLVGLTAEVKATRQTSASGTTLTAVRIEVETPEAREVEVSGQIDRFGDSFLVVSGVTVSITSTTSMRGQPQVGAKAEVKAIRQSDGSLLAVRVQIEPAAAQIVTFRGVVEAMTSDAWVVSGVTVTITDTTDIRGDAQVGSQVEVRAVRQPDGSLRAVRIQVQGEVEDLVTEFRGLIQRVESGFLVVGGITVTLTDTTRIIGTPAVNARAEVHARRLADGTLLAERIVIEDEMEAEFRGVIQSIGATQWVIQGTTVTITSTTRIIGDPAVGSTAEVHAMRLPGGQLLAMRIVVEGAEEAETELSGTISSITPDVWVVGGITVQITTTTVITGGTPQVGATAEVKGVTQADGSILATRIKVEEAEAAEKEFQGMITRIESSFWVVGGITVQLTTTTSITGGTPQVGAMAEVKGVTQADGSVLASRIQVRSMREQERERGGIEALDAEAEVPGEVHAAGGDAPGAGIDAPGAGIDVSASPGPDGMLVASWIELRA